MIFKNKFPPDHLFYCSPLDPKKLEMISGWTVGGSDLIAVTCSMMMNKRGTREGAERKETHQLCPNNIWMDGWVLPKGGKSTIRTRLCTNNQSNLDNF